MESPTFVLTFNLFSAFFVYNMTRMPACRLWPLSMPETEVHNTEPTVIDDFASEQILANRHKDKRLEFNLRQWQLRRCRYSVYTTTALSIHTLRRVNVEMCIIFKAYFAQEQFNMIRYLRSFTVLNQVVKRYPGQQQQL